MKLLELIDRWNTGEGRPYKGSLIDWSAYNRDNHDIGCMCAQGQVLHFVGGWSPERLHNSNQNDADTETAKLLNISRAHAVLLRRVNDNADGAPAIVLENPGSVLGDEWSKLLDFWWHLDTMTAKQWDAVGEVAWSSVEWDVASHAARVAGGDFAWETALAVAGTARVVSASARTTVRDFASTPLTTPLNAAGASREIQGLKILSKNETPFFFLPAFGFASIDDIPARPVNYGVQP